MASLNSSISDMYTQEIAFTLFKDLLRIGTKVYENDVSTLWIIVDDLLDTILLSGSFSQIVRTRSLLHS